MAPTTESPHSSMGSYIGTPDTRMTAFSPDDVRVPKNSPAGLTTPHKIGTEQDPFVSAKKSKGLSAGAHPFAPQKPPMPGSLEHVLSAIATAAGTGLGRDLIEPEISQFGTFTINTLKTRNLRIGSLSGRDVMQAIESIFNELVQSGYVMKGHRRIFSAGNNVLIKLESLEDVAAVHGALQGAGDLMSEFVSAREFHQVVSPQDGTLRSSHEGEIVVRVSNAAMSAHSSKLKFGEAVIATVQADGKLCAWKRLPDPGYFHLIAEFSDISSVPRAIARMNGQRVGDGNSILSVTVHEPDLANNGAIARYQPPTQQSIQTPTRRGEIFDLNTALGNLNVGMGMNPSFSPVQMGPMNGFTSGFMMMSPAYGQQQFYPAAVPVPMSAFAQMQNGFGYSPQPSPFNHMQLGSPDSHLRRLGNDYSPVANRDGSLQRRLQNNRALTPGRNRNNAMNNHHNVVEIFRITSGSDVRTTVMLRNIPNKVDQAMLKAIIDESSFGRYDFLYLRIDFSNNCNVGYAFINFVDPLDIVQTRANKPWDSFKSDKIAEVSYATIQGRDCLIQKFRNSSVMLEPPHYRPKLFITEADPPGYGVVGEEDEFPASDNASKLKRSCENAEHVGLFAPSAGQHMRDEQRRRRSQYDRGTSLAAQEEFDYDPFGYSSY